MKILSITNDIDSGGAAKSLFILARQLARAGHALTVASISRPVRTSLRAQQLEDMGVAVHYLDIPYYPMSLVACPIPFWKNVRRGVGAIGELRRLRRLAADLASDVVHYNSYTTLNAALVLPGRPSVLHAREVLLENSPLLAPTRALVRSRMREVVAISPVEAEQAERLFKLPATTVYNAALEPPHWTPMPDDGGLVYGMFSHVSPMKGHELCIRAAARVADRLRAAGVRIRLHGGSIGIHAALHETLEGTVRSLGVEDIVGFKGFTARPEEVMRGAHLLLRPDLTGHPWGRDIIEAMSLGRPVLATGSRETFVTPDQTGMLVPPGDEAAFAEAMVALADRDKLEAMGRRALAFAETRFDPAANSDQVLGCLERVARRDQRAPGSAA